MKRFATLLLSALPLLAHASEDPLQAERWKTRPLIVLAAGADDPLLMRVQAALREPANREAFVERDMVLYTVIGTGVHAKALTFELAPELVEAVNDRGLLTIEVANHL